MNNLNFNDQEALNQLRENREWYLLLGIGLVVFGTLAIVYSFITTLLSVVYLGISLLVLGVFEVIKSFKINKWGNFFLHVFLGILYSIAGIFIFMNPLVNALTLTLFLAIFFIISGILKIVFIFSKRVVHKGFLLLNGLLSILLGVLLLLQWPFSGLWIIGAFVGIKAIITGWTWIILSMQANKINNENKH